MAPLGANGIDPNPPPPPSFLPARAAPPDGLDGAPGAAERPQPGAGDRKGEDAAAAEAAGGAGDQGMGFFQLSDLNPEQRPKKCPKPGIVLGKSPSFGQAMLNLQPTVQGWKDSEPGDALNSWFGRLLVANFDFGQKEAYGGNQEVSGRTHNNHASGQKTVFRVERKRRGALRAYEFSLLQDVDIVPRAIVRGQIAGLRSQLHVFSPTTEGKMKTY